MICMHDGVVMHDTDVMADVRVPRLRPMASTLSGCVFRRLIVMTFPSRYFVPKRILLYAVNMDPITAIRRPLEAILRGICILAIAIIVRFLYRGYKVRKSLRSLQAQGIVLP